MATPGVRLGSSTSDPLYLQTNNTNAVSIDTSQNVGIGTDSTGGEALRIYRSSGSTAAIYSNTSNATISVSGYNSTTAVTAALEVSNTAAALGTITNHPLRLLTNSIEAIRINTSQNVGIGTSTIGARLHVHSGATDEVARFEGTGNPYISLYDSGTRTGYLYSNTNSLELVSEATKDLMLQAASAVIIKSNGNNERVRVLSGGTVGIGTTSTSLNSGANVSQVAIMTAADSTFTTWALRLWNPGGPGRVGLEFVSDPVAGGNNWRPGFISSDDNGSFTGKLLFYTNGTGSGSKWGSTLGMTVQNGSVGIGTSNPATRLHVDGTIRNVNMPTGALGNYVVKDASNNISYLVSSRRYKKDIKNYTSGIDQILKLNPVNYVQIGFENLMQAGFIAEDLDDQGLKEFVVYDTKNRPDSIDYSRMVVLLTNGIKELKSENDSLKSEIQSLKDQISSILNMLNNK